MNVVLLSTSKERADAVRAASRRKGFPCTVVHDDAQASAAIEQKSNEGIFVVDAEATADLQRLLRSRHPNWPILVLSAHFDSSAWVELFKAGASEIIGDPLHPTKLDAALDGFLNHPSPRATSWWHNLTRRLGMR